MKVENENPEPVQVSMSPFEADLSKAREQSRNFNEELEKELTEKYPEEMAEVQAQRAKQAQEKEIIVMSKALLTSLLTPKETQGKGIKNLNFSFNLDLE